MLLTDCRTKIAGSDGKGGRLQDAAARLGVSAGGPLDAAIASAVAEYSRVKPRPVAAKLAGAGAFDFAINSATFPGYVDQWSCITAVIHPYDVATQVDPLDESLWRVERLDTGIVLRLLFTVPVGQYILVRYTAAHDLTASATTVPVADDEAVADLGAHYACLALADYYAQATDASISADVDDRRGKSDLWRSNATRWREAWNRKLGLDSDGQPLRRERVGVRRLERA